MFLYIPIMAYIILLSTGANCVFKIWLFVLLGVGVGAFLHGYVPQEFFINICQMIISLLCH